MPAVKGLEFYSTAAQVIPLLLIVLVFELRTFRTLGHASQLKKWSGLAVLLFAGLGEHTALRATFNDESGHYDAWIVGLSLAVLWNAIIILAVVAPMDRARWDRMRERDRTRESR
jgi:hypothetical protein